MTGVLQGCLLVMGITFELRARRKGKAGEGDVNGDGIAPEHGSREEDHERTGLLGNER